MDIRIDERPKHACAFDNGMKVELQFTGEGKVRALPGCDDDAIEWTNGLLTLFRAALDENTVAILDQALRGEGHDEIEALVFDEASQPLAEPLWNELLTR